MRLTAGKLAKLNREYNRYLSGKRLDDFFKDFGIPFAAGHWCAGEFSDRFNPSGYSKDEPSFDPTIIAQIRRVAEARIQGIELHDQVLLDEKDKPGEAVIREVKAALRKYKVKATNMNIDLWGAANWKLGGVTNPNPRMRRKALAKALQAVDLAVEVGCSSVALWPGSDGWDYNFQVNYGTQLNWFTNACIAINKKAKKAGLRFGTEAKLHEPREGNMVVSTTHKAMLVAARVNRVCGGTNMGVAIDYGHEQMCAVEPADTLYTAKAFGVPVVNFHINTAKLHSNDEDRVTGTGDIWRFVDFCYAALDTGYSGWFGEDQFTYRMNQVKAMSLSRELFGNLMKKALKIYALRDELTKAQSTGDAGQTIDVVKRIMLTG